MAAEHKVVEIAMPQTPEGLYHEDQARMRIDAFRRRVHPDILAAFDEAEETIIQTVLVGSSSPGTPWRHQAPGP